LFVRNRIGEVFFLILHIHIWDISNSVRRRGGKSGLKVMDKFICNVIWIKHIISISITNGNNTIPASTFLNCIVKESGVLAMNGPIFFSTLLIILGEFGKVYLVLVLVQELIALGI
jgi:hypothetical protein